VRGEVQFIDCSVCGVEHVDYLLCGGASHLPGKAESIFVAAARAYFEEVRDEVRGFDFISALARKFRAMYQLGQKAGV
jgi:hypothetical protein